MNEPEILEQQTFKFDSEQDYAWQASDSFSLKGKELEILHNTLGAIFSSVIPDSQMYLMLNECFKISSDIIKRNVENGLITEAVKTQDNENHGD